MAERITVERCKKLLAAMGKKGKFKVEFQQQITTEVPDEKHDDGSGVRSCAPDGVSGVREGRAAR